MKTLSEQLRIWHAYKDGPTQLIEHSDFPISFWIKRLDQIKSWASGNKYFKLKYSILGAIEDRKKIVVSKGGPYSNHLEALASACAQFDLQCVCVIRSYQSDNDNPTIADLRKKGAVLDFLAPDEYQSFDQSKAEELYPGCLFIPEGGFNEDGIRGSSEIYSSLTKDHFTHLIIPGGTMTTVAGILSVADPEVKIIVISAWKGCTDKYVQDVLSLSDITPRAKWEIWPDHHFGGFAKYNEALARFMLSFTTETTIPLDPVYTGKMMYALNDKMKQGYFLPTDKIACIHTGGLQGIAGFNHRDPVLWSEYYKLTTNN